MNFCRFRPLGVWLSSHGKAGGAGKDWTLAPGQRWGNRTESGVSSTWGSRKHEAGEKEKATGVPATGGGGRHLVLETWPGEAVGLLAAVRGDMTWRRPSEGTVMAGSGQCPGGRGPRGEARGGTSEHRQHGGVGPHVSRRAQRPAPGLLTQEGLRPSTRSLDSEHRLFYDVWSKFKTAF